MNYSNFKASVKDRIHSFFFEMDEVYANPLLTEHEKKDEFVRIGDDYGMDHGTISQLVVA